MTKSPESQPSPEEVRKAESMMTEEQQEKSESREEMIEKISEHLDSLHNDAFERSKVDKQCRDRFGKSWDEVRSELKEKLGEGLELLPTIQDSKGKHQGVNIRPRDVIRGIIDHTNNWMIRRYLEVLYLSYPRRWEKVTSHEALEKGIEPKSFESPIEELDVAEDVLPEKVKEVLKSHGLEIQGSGEEK